MSGFLPSVAHPQELFIWQGFSHEWQRTAIGGFRVPNRLSGFRSFIEHQTPVQDSVFTVGQETGVDGNFMEPEGYFARINTTNLFVEHGQVELIWDDLVQPVPWIGPEASGFQTVRVEVPLPPGDSEEAEMFLQGVEFEPACRDPLQPDEQPCNGNGVWPVGFDVNIDNCAIVDVTLGCDVTVQLDRAWTPSLGGVPNFFGPILSGAGPIICEKPLNQVTRIFFTVHYSVISGNSLELRNLGENAAQRIGKLHDNQPTLQDQRTIQKPANVSVVNAFKQFGFRLTTSPLRGRYLLGWGVQTNVVNAGPTATITTTADVAAPTLTTKNATVETNTRTTTLLVHGNTMERTVSEQICIPQGNPNPAPATPEEFACAALSTFNCVNNNLIERPAVTVAMLNNNFPLPPNSCSDGIQNGNESGVDCGSSCNTMCPTPMCTDGIENGDEQGVDCGGSSCLNMC